jgi:hypothetical protein
MWFVSMPIYPESYVASVDVWPGLSCRSELLTARWLTKTEMNS